MRDRYATLAHSGVGKALVRRLGLPEPPQLRRYQPGGPLIAGPVLVAGAPGGRLADSVGKLLAAAGVELAAEPVPADRPTDRPPMYAGLVFDATGIDQPAGLRALYDFFHPRLRTLYPNGRVIVLGRPPAPAGGMAAAAAQRALAGFTRSLAKELRRGATCQLVQVAPEAEEHLDSTLRFLLSDRSAYITGQVVRLGPVPVPAPPPADPERPLAGKIALVTGAGGAIGAATARVLARDGAEVVCLDVAAAGDGLVRVANEVGGSALQLDLTAADAPDRLVEHLAGRYGRADILVHNAGITRDRTLAKMPADWWDAVLEVNLAAVARTTSALLDAGLVPDGGRLVAVSSINGIAGNLGQTNYAASKAGLIGLVEALAAELAGRGGTANAVAPGFIATPMTDRMPRLRREVARRLNTFAQAGLPVDVAEAISWLASPGSGAVTGQVIRVCGQSLIGA